MKFIKVSARTKGNFYGNYDEKFAIYQQWESYKDKTNLESSFGLNRAFETAGEVWPFMMLEKAFYSNAI